MIESNPTVTIGLPVFNGMPFIKDTLECMLEQTYRDFEFVIMDNDSTDGTSAVCERYARLDSRIRYFRNTTNIGMAPNFNKAIERARGRYFTYTAADDLYHPQFLEKIVHALESSPQASLGFSNTKFIDHKGAEIPTNRIRFNGFNWEYIDDFGSQITFEANDPDDRQLESPRPDVRFSQFVRRSRAGFELYGLVRTDILRSTRLLEGYFSSDKTLLAELALRGTFVKVADDLYYRRIHSDQISAVKDADVRDQVQEVAKYTKKALRFPQQQLLAGLIRAVGDAEMTLAQKLNCYLAIGRWAMQPRKIAIYLRQYGANIVRRIR